MKENSINISASFFNHFKSIILLLFFLLLINLFSVFSATVDRYGSLYLLKELTFIIIGISLAIFWIFISFKNYQKGKAQDVIDNLKVINIYILITGFTLSILMIFLPNEFAPYINGARRWIKIPELFSIAPVELIKFGFLFIIALIFSSNKFLFHIDKKHSFEIYFPFYLFFLFLTIFVVISQKDLGNFVLLVSILISIIFIYFVNNKSALIFILLCFALLTIFIIMEPHRVDRILSWISSFYSDINLSKISSYQITHGFYTINEGIHNSIFGVGYLNSEIKMKVPELHTDMVFTVLLAEFGYFGLIFYVSSIFLLIFLMFKKIEHIKDYLLFIYTSAISLMILITILINLWGVIGIIPFKGISVPFLSYGGSVIVSLILLFTSWCILVYFKEITKIEKIIN